jgi:hypothetical protein
MEEKFPVEAIIHESFRRTLSRRNELIRLCWPYAILIIVSSTGTQAVNSTALSIILVLLSGAFSVLAAVRCHRVFLLSEAEAHELSAFKWGQRETQFLLNVIGISLMTSVISIPSIIIYIQTVEFLGYDIPESNPANDLLAILVYLPVYYFVARWALILPDTALDIGRKLSWAWHVTRGHSFQLFIVIGLVPFLFAFVIGLLSYLFGESPIFHLVQAIIWVPIAAVEICLLSLSYEWINSRSGAERQA